MIPKPFGSGKCQRGDGVRVTTPLNLWVLSGYSLACPGQGVLRTPHQPPTNNEPTFTTMTTTLNPVANDLGRLLRRSPRISEDVRPIGVT